MRAAGLQTPPLPVPLILRRCQNPDNIASNGEMVKVKDKAIPVTDRGDPYGCETLRFLHFLDNRFTDGGEVVSLTRWQTAFYPQEDSWYSFLLEAESNPGP
jgi:hypothetical protein